MFKNLTELDKSIADIEIVIGDLEKKLGPISIPKNTDTFVSPLAGIAPMSSPISERIKKATSLVNCYTIRLRELNSSLDLDNV